jgi:DNA-binding MarR family transcriptional regulator
MDYIKHEARREDVYTTVYDPGEPGSQDLKSLLNPVLKYIEPVKPLEFYALYTLRANGSLAIADLATRLGAHREDVEEAVNTLAGRGYIEVYREGNKKMAKYIKGLYRGLRKTAPSEEGYKLAKRVLLYYARRGYIVAPVRQDPGLSSRPDLVAVPVDKSTWRPVYSKAIAVEVESCNEVETHPEQVAHNWVKESVKDFAEVHTWTWDACLNKLKQIYEKANVDKAKVRIFSTKLPAEKPAEKQPAEQAPLKPPAAPPRTVLKGPIVEHVETVQAQLQEIGKEEPVETPMIEPEERREASCSGGRVEFKLSDGRVVCIQGDVAGVLRVFAERGYRVEASRSRIVVYDERGEEVFSSSF